MIDGIYSISFRGRSDWGIGMLHLQKGKVAGADAAGVTYEGTYSEFEGRVRFNITMIVPPGVALVQGTAPKTKEYSIPFNANVPISALMTGATVALDMPPGPVNVIFRRLRPLD